MTADFTSAASPLDAEGVQLALDGLGVRAAQFWAVLQVETSGCGFLADRRPTILFERHIFSRRTQGDFDASHPGISQPQAGGYGQGGGHQYERLAEAIALDRRAALESTSWGMGQVMGFNASAVGYADAETMVAAMCASEAAQVQAMAAFIAGQGLAGALRSSDWARFARGYNGANYRINNYDTRLAAACDAMDRGTLPDLDIRTGQLRLSFLGFDPQGVDGVMGKLTRSAMHDFQDQAGIPRSDFFDAATLAALAERTT